MQKWRHCVAWFRDWESRECVEGGEDGDEMERFEKYWEGELEEGLREENEGRVWSMLGAVLGVEKGGKGVQSLD